MRFEEVYHTTPRPGAYRGFYGLWNDVKKEEKGRKGEKNIDISATSLTNRYNSVHTHVHNTFDIDSAT